MAENLLTAKDLHQAFHGKKDVTVKDFPRMRSWRFRKEKLKNFTMTGMGSYGPNNLVISKASSDIWLKLEDNSFLYFALPPKDVKINIENFSGTRTQTAPLLFTFANACVAQTDNKHKNTNLENVFRACDDLQSLRYLEPKKYADVKVIAPESELLGTVARFPGVEAYRILRKISNSNPENVYGAKDRVQALLEHFEKIYKIEVLVHNFYPLVSTFKEAFSKNKDLQIAGNSLSCEYGLKPAITGYEEDRWGRWQTAGKTDKEKCLIYCKSINSLPGGFVVLLDQDNFKLNSVFVRNSWRGVDSLLYKRETLAGHNFSLGFFHSRESKAVGGLILTAYLNAIVNFLSGAVPIEEEHKNCVFVRTKFEGLPIDIYDLATNPQLASEKSNFITRINECLTQVQFKVTVDHL